MDILPEIGVPPTEWQTKLKALWAKVVGTMKEVRRKHVPIDKPANITSFSCSYAAPLCPPLTQTALPEGHGAATARRRRRRRPAAAKIQPREGRGHHSLRGGAPPPRFKTDGAQILGSDGAPAAPAADRPHTDLHTHSFHQTGEAGSMSDGSV